AAAAAADAHVLLRTQDAPQARVRQRHMMNFAVGITTLARPVKRARSTRQDFIRHPYTRIIRSYIKYRA
ncbi:MAG TPA: hypothetical protein DHW10_05600, partial [Rhodospirillaceae bacterium]|nr:hypothetical protein [Rhodospirillaceae bacterium]